MARRRKEKPAFDLDEVFALLKLTPVWVGPVLAVLAFSFLRYVVPLFFPQNTNGVDMGGLWRPFFSMLAWLIGAAILAAWLAAEVWKLFNRKMLDNQTGIGSIRDLSWREFERLVSEAYRRKGYTAEVIGIASGDGGVDILLLKPGEKVLVQCKQWKAYKVGVNVVRELLGVVVSEKATKGILVTSGRFTQEAITFASSNPQIELVDGPRLEELVRGVQAPSATHPAIRSAVAPGIATAHPFTR